MARTVIEWITPAGVITNLNDWDETFVVKGWSGWFDVPFVLNSYEVPLQAGEAFASVKIKARELDVPIMVLARTRSDFLKKVRSLVSLFDPNNGEGRIRIKQEGVEPREIYCRYKSGFEGAMSGSAWSVGSARFVITFRASDPFFYSLVKLSASYAIASTVNFFPFFPLRFTFTGVLSTATITNPGDYVSYPVWTITGPGNDLVLRNNSTGYQLTSNIIIPSGSVLTIDTRPGRKSVLMNGVNYFYTLTQDSVLWELIKGSNSISVTLNNADANTRIALDSSVPYYGA